MALMQGILYSYRLLFLNLMGFIIVLNGCKMGPNYVRPDVIVNKEFENKQGFISSRAENSSEGNIEYSIKVSNEKADWWAILGDSQLNSMIQQALQNNFEIAKAVAVLDDLRAKRGVAHAALWPAIKSNVSYTHYQQSLETPGANKQFIEAGQAKRSDGFYNAAIETQWELDLFGAVRRAKESVSAQLDAGINDYRAVQLAIVAETAIAYFTLQDSRLRLDNLNQFIDLQRQQLAIIEQNYQAGLVSKAQWHHIQAQSYKLQANRAQLSAADKANLYRLGALVGAMPGELEVDTATPQALTATIAVGTPADLLRRRPDIMAVERRLAASTANIGVAKANFFPKLRLSASYAFESQNIGRLLTSNAQKVGVVPLVSWSLFEGKRLRFQLQSANAQQKIAAANYEQAVLNALVESESRLNAYRQQTFAAQQTVLALKNAQQQQQINANKFSVGLINQIQQISSHQDFLNHRDEWILAITRQRIGFVNLYKAVGGSFAVKLEL